MRSEWHAVAPERSEISRSRSDRQRRSSGRVIRLPQAETRNFGRTWSRPQTWTPRILTSNFYAKAAPQSGQYSKHFLVIKIQNHFGAKTTNNIHFYEPKISPATNIYITRHIMGKATIVMRNGSNLCQINKRQFLSPNSATISLSV